MLPAPFIADVQSLIGSNRLLEESADLQRYGVDRTTVWQPAPSAIALPGSVEEVQQLVVLANQYDVAEEALRLGCLAACDESAVHEVIGLALLEVSLATVA